MLRHIRGLDVVDVDSWEQAVSWTTKRRELPNGGVACHSGQSRQNEWPSTWEQSAAANGMQTACEMDSKPVVQRPRRHPCRVCELLFEIWATRACCFSSSWQHQLASHWRISPRFRSKTDSPRLQWTKIGLRMMQSASLTSWPTHDQLINGWHKTSYRQNGFQLFIS